MKWIAVMSVTGLSVTAAWGMGDNQTIQSIDIEEQVAQCRKDCVEQECLPQFTTCIGKDQKAKPACEAERTTCEQRCIQVDCMT